MKALSIRVFTPWGRYSKLFLRKGDAVYNVRLNRRPRR